jgi:Uma2 family endonuclease
VAEILSPSTQAYDRGEKLRAFQTIPSLELILLIEAETASVTLLTRLADGWQEQIVEGRSSRLALAPLGIEVSLDDIYDLVEFE